jgi:hypothetical protein
MEHITNEVLDGKINVIMAHMENVKGDVSEIKEQTTKTNGRVNALEDWQLTLMTQFSTWKKLTIPILIAIGFFADKITDYVINIITK